MPRGSDPTVYSRIGTGVTPVLSLADLRRMSQEADEFDRRGRESDQRMRVQQLQEEGLRRQAAAAQRAQADSQAIDDIFKKFRDPKTGRIDLDGAVNEAVLVNPREALSRWQGFDEQQKASIAREREIARLVGVEAGAILDAPEAERPRLYTAAWQRLAQTGLVDMSKIPEVYGPQVETDMRAAMLRARDFSDVIDYYENQGKRLADEQTAQAKADKEALEYEDLLFADVTNQQEWDAARAQVRDSRRGRYPVPFFRQMVTSAKTRRKGSRTANSDYARHLERWAADRGLVVDELTSGQELEARDDFYRASRRPLTPRGGTSGKENPAFPQGVVTYLEDLRRQGLSRTEAEQEVFANRWLELQGQYPRISMLEVQQGINRLFPADESRLEPSEPPPAPTGGRGVPTPSAAGRPGGRPTTQRRTATMQDVRAVARRAGISESEARRRLEAQGVSITR